jgi:hypothetical protein
MATTPNARTLTILAQDPSVTLNGAIVFAEVDVPAEVLSDGPTGHRVKVVDFDASAHVLYEPRRFGATPEEQAHDPYKPRSHASPKARRKWEKEVLSDPAFHAQHCYAVVMRTLARFESALGRRVSWGFQGHQLHVAPHAFLEANAFYSEADQALVFGYFKSARTGETVHTCLSHDIVAHETTHAILDGLRDSFTHPSTPDQAAFHEGFADVVALLSVFSLPEIVATALQGTKPLPASRGHIRLISHKRVSRQAIEQSMLLGLGEQFGAHLDGARANALRRSITVKPNRTLLSRPEYQEEHDRGEVFAAAALHGFLTMWTHRIHELGTFPGNKYNLDRVIEEGAKAAADLLTMFIRALDYCPPVDLSFGDFLAALLTADAETVPDDSRFAYRAVIRKSFMAYGIDPPPRATDTASGLWTPFDPATPVTYGRTHFQSMLHDEEEVFRFIWENRAALQLEDLAHTYVESVRPSVRLGPDGFTLRETICVYVQVHHLFGAELVALGIQLPDGMTTRQPVTLYGGGTLVFDEYGRIKYHIRKDLLEVQRQSARLKYLWESGLIDAPASKRDRFANMHRCRML